LQAQADEIHRRGAEVIAISSSAVEDHARLARKLGAHFPILSDAKGEAIRAYGLLHPDAVWGMTAPIARPAVFLIDKNGTIADRWLTDNWRVRARPERLLAMLAKLSR
jgi:peroxiredoxin